MEKIIVFGMGKYFESKREELLQKYQVICFLDNKVKEEGRVYGEEQIPVLSPLSVAKEEKVPIFLMSVHFIGMWKQLVELGVSPDRLVFPFFVQPYFEIENVLNIYIKEIKFEKTSLICEQKDGGTVEIESDLLWRQYVRKLYGEEHPIISAIASMNQEPVSRQFGAERGLPIDRYYIEKFLEINCNLIRGDVLEIEDNTYSLKYGRDRLSKSIVMDVSSSDEKVTFNGNLETGEGIRDNIADCFILTQTLMYMFDLKSVAHNIVRLLKENGTALITCSGISQNSVRCMDNYGCYFNFNASALKRMFEDEDVVVEEIGSFGNVKTVSAHLNGLCCEDLIETDFEPNDKYYPLIVYAVVKRRG